MLQLTLARVRVRPSVCALSVARVLTLHRAADPRDPSWDNTDAALWSVVEMNGAILCSSVPTLRPLFARKMRGLKSTLSRSRSRSRSRSQSLSTAGRADEEAILPPPEPMPELHLVDLEELARRSCRVPTRQRSETKPRTASRPPTRPKSKPRPDTGVFVTVERGSTDGFETLLAQMAGDVPSTNTAQSHRPEGTVPRIIVTTDMSVKESEERMWT